MSFAFIYSLVTRNGGDCLYIASDIDHNCTFTLLVHTQQSPGIVVWHKDKIRKRNAGNEVFEFLEPHFNNMGIQDKEKMDIKRLDLLSTIKFARKNVFECKEPHFKIMGNKEKQKIGV